MKWPSTQLDLIFNLKSKERVKPISLAMNSSELNVRLFKTVKTEFKVSRTIMKT